MELIKLHDAAPLLQVYDMPRSLKFYRDILNFRVLQSAPPGDEDHADWVLLENQSIQVMLNTAYEAHQRPDMEDVIRKNHHQDFCLYFGCPDIDKLYAHLHSVGYAVDSPGITGYGWKALHLVDPDGYGLCFHWPVPPLTTD